MQVRMSEHFKRCISLVVPTSSTSFLLLQDCCALGLPSLYLLSAKEVYFLRF